MKYIKIINLISIYGLIFFAFLAVATVRKPSYLPFSATDESVNICCIVFMMYMAVFLLTCCIQRSQDSEQPRDGEDQPRQHSGDKIYEQDIHEEPQLVEKDEVQIERY